MAKVISFAQTTSSEEALKLSPLFSARNSGLSERLNVANQQALTAMLATIDAIAFALDQVENIQRSLPDGPNKRLLQQQRAALCCSLFQSRTMAHSLSSDIAKLTQKAVG